MNWIKMSVSPTCYFCIIGFSIFFSRMEGLRRERKFAYRYPATTLNLGNPVGPSERPFWPSLGSCPLLDTEQSALWYQFLQPHFMAAVILQNVLVWKYFWLQSHNIWFVKLTSGLQTGRAKTACQKIGYILLRRMLWRRSAGGYAP